MQLYSVSAHVILYCNSEIFSSVQCMAQHCACFMIQDPHHSGSNEGAGSTMMYQLYSPESPVFIEWGPLQLHTSKCAFTIHQWIVLRE